MKSAASTFHYTTNAATTCRNKLEHEDSKTRRNRKHRGTGVDLVWAHSQSSITNLKKNGRPRQPGLGLPFCFQPGLCLLLFGLGSNLKPYFRRSPSRLRDFVLDV